MNKIQEKFLQGKCFIPFITCGFPSLEITERLVLEMEKSGADIIELGIPFSDPTAEGVVIQNASMQALQNGVTTDSIFAMVKRLRTKTQIPLIFMTYANVLFSYGLEKFIQNCVECGINGIILPDVPFEEKNEFATICYENGIAFISLIAPTSQERIKMIAKEAKGFVYCVSSVGVTGVRKEINTDIGAMVDLVKEVNPTIACAVGFGISTPEQAKYMAQFADGVIVGSSIVKLCAEHKENCVSIISAYVASMKNAIR